MSEGGAKPPTSAKARTSAEVDVVRHVPRPSVKREVVEPIGLRARYVRSNPEDQTNHISAPRAFGPA